MGCEDNKSNDDGRFFRLRSRGIFDEISFFGKRYRDFLGNGGQISPNCDVISSMIDWLSIKYGELDDDGGVRRLTIDIDFEDSVGDDDDKQGESNVGRVNKHVESVRSIVSRLIILGGEDDNELFSSIDDDDDDDEHTQCPNDVIVLNNVK